jgi:hypothetical protein
MRSLYRHSGLLSVVMAFSALILATAASADSLVSESLASDGRPGWSPGPVTGVDAQGHDWSEETEDHFAWAGDRDLGLLVSFDPDEEEVFLGWQVDF